MFFSLPLGVAPRVGKAAHGLHHPALHVHVRHVRGMMVAVLCFVGLLQAFLKG